MALKVEKETVSPTFFSFLSFPSLFLYFFSFLASSLLPGIRRLATSSGEKGARWVGVMEGGGGRALGVVVGGTATAPDGGLQK